jgi:hypothetical protein
MEEKRRAMNHPLRKLGMLDFDYTASEEQDDDVDFL